MLVQKAKIENGTIKANLLGKITENEISDGLIQRLIPIEEDLTGQIDGTNTIFRTSYEFYPSSVEVFINGLKQIIGRHFAIVNNRDIELFDTLQTGDLIVIKYIRR